MREHRDKMKSREDWLPSLETDSGKQGLWKCLRVLILFRIESDCQYLVRLYADSRELRVIFLRKNIY